MKSDIASTTTFDPVADAIGALQLLNTLEPHALMWRPAGCTCAEIMEEIEDDEG